MGTKSKNGQVAMQLNVKEDVWEFHDRKRNTVNRISRKEFFSLLIPLTRGDDILFELTPEEEADILEWSSQAIKLVVEDEFVGHGFTWAEMEQWAAVCYSLHINPLPALRELLQDSEIPVYYRGDDLGQFDRPGLVCFERFNRRRESVKLIAHGTFEELAAKAAEKEAILQMTRKLSS